MNDLKIKCEINEKENNKEVILHLENDCIQCPCCYNKELISKGYQLCNLSLVGIIDFLKADILTLKKKRYTCKKCNSNFSFQVQGRFKKRILDEEFKPFLKILLNKGLVDFKEVDKNIKDDLNLCDEWKCLYKNRVITLINIQTAEIKEFTMVNKKRSRVYNNLIFEERYIDYIPLYRKNKPILDQRYIRKYRNNK